MMRLNYHHCCITFASRARLSLCALLCDQAALSAFHGVAQPIARWRSLPSLSPDGAVPASSKFEPAEQGFSDTSSAGARHDHKPEPAETATASDVEDKMSDPATPTLGSQADSEMPEEGSRAPLAVAAGFVQTPSGLCCCIAVAKPGPWQHDKAHLETLVQPVWPAASARSATWQETVLPLASREGEPFAWETCRAADPCHVRCTPEPARITCHSHAHALPDGEYALLRGISKQDAVLLDMCRHGSSVKAAAPAKYTKL